MSFDYPDEPVKTGGQSVPSVDELFVRTEAGNSDTHIDDLLGVTVTDTSM